MAEDRDDQSREPQDQNNQQQPTAQERDRSAFSSETGEQGQQAGDSFWLAADDEQPGI